MKWLSAVAVSVVLSIAIVAYSDAKAITNPGN